MPINPKVEIRHGFSAIIDGLAESPVNLRHVEWCTRWNFAWYVS